MSLAIVHTRANIGVDAPAVTVETHLSNGLPGIAIVGLPETAVRESRERVRCAILNAGMEFPARRMTINLAPADLPKSGGRYDLAIAVSILAASGQVPLQALTGCEVLGELALTGELRGVEGVLPAGLASRAAGRSLLLPAANHEEACLVRGLSACSAADLRSICDFLCDAPGRWRRCRFRAPAPAPRRERSPLAAIRGQGLAKRALVIAAAGGHDLLLAGPPGTGKTLLANALHGLLPALPESHALEVAAIRSVAGPGYRLQTAGNEGNWLQPPLRAPHHNATAVALTGGGHGLSPGEVTLAHRGLLFLDELPEFSRHALEVLREPMEAGAITVSRARHRLRFPARFQLVATMNPCPCGYDGDPGGHCRCTPERITRYLDRLSGPFLDRLDMAVDVPRLTPAQLMGKEDAGQGSDVSLRDIAECRDRQWQRNNGVLNGELEGERLRQICVPDVAARNLLEDMMEAGGLSARAVHRLLRTARTIADLEQTGRLGERHVAEALVCRNLSRFPLAGGAAPAAGQ
ncbi:MAG: YifB family Mg chelatase-like AAA ATPase [Pseudohongiellaceae bacterium]